MENVNRPTIPYGKKGNPFQQYSVQDPLTGQYHTYYGLSSSGATDPYLQQNFGGQVTTFGGRGYEAKTATTAQKKAESDRLQNWLAQNRKMGDQYMQQGSPQGKIDCRPSRGVAPSCQKGRTGVRPFIGIWRSGRDSNPRPPA